MKTIKIGHLIHWDGPGGGPQAVINLARGLKQQGIEQVVICGGQGRLAAFCRQEGMEQITVPIDRKITLPWGFCRLVWALKRSPLDRLFLHGQWAGPIGALAARMAGISTVYVCHWPAFYTDWNPFRAFLNALAEWIPCRLARWVVALSPSVHYQYLYRGWAKEDKLCLIPNLFSIEEVPSADESKAIRSRLDDEEKNLTHVVSVGRLSDQKRIDWLIRAWARVSAKCPRARIWIVGDGPEEETLKRLTAELKIQDTCRFLGAQPRGIAYLAAGDIAVMTTMYEASGYVPLEAMACGRPIIVTAADGVRDQVTDGVEGRLVPPGDIQQLADALIELIENPALRERMGTAGRQRLSRVMSVPALDQYVDLLKDLP